MAILNEFVLIVDDDEIQLEITDNLLQHLGVEQIITAQSGMEALERLETNPGITTILLDIMMPDMDGSKFLHHIAPSKIKANIILVSSLEINALKSIANTGRALGVNVVGFVSKPIPEQALLKQLEHQSAKRNRQSNEGEKAGSDLSVQLLVDAINGDQIVPWYQPKVDINDFSLLGVEALARWKKADGSMLSPGVFIPAIESSGLSDMLFFYMMEKVLGDMQAWKDAGRKFKASVNMTMDCAFNKELPKRLQMLVNAYNVDPSDLIIEVTESRIVSDNSVVVENLQKISEMGIVLSIDDFGTGYSSLSQIASLPFGELKIDGSFVQQSGTSKKADAILQSTITLGRSLGLNLVAEGVETHEQFDLLKDMGADTIQGYLTAKPMEASKFDQWISDWRPGTRNQPGCERPLAVLVVDDDRSIRLYLEALFKEAVGGAEIFLAENGEQAIQLMKQRPIDAVTLDFHMPGINGLKLLYSLRNIQPAARYVLLTVETREKIAREAIRLGALYCPKPITEAQFRRILQFFRR